jgi:hypothetical protein
METRLLTHRPESGWSSPLPSELDSARTLVTAFAPTAYAERDDFWASIAAAFPRSHVLSCSSAGAIAGEHVVDDTAVAVVARFDRAGLASASVPIQALEMSRRAGQKLGRALAEGNPHAVIVVADGMHAQGAELVQGIAEALPAGTRIVGGMAGDGAACQRTWTLVEGVPRSGWVAAVALSGPVEVGAAAHGGWRAFGPPRRVSRAEGSVVLELDGRPALAVYAEQLGDLARGLPAAAKRFPLAVRVDGNDGTELMRTVQAIDTAAQSLSCAGDVPQGSVVRLARAGHEQLIDSAQRVAIAAVPRDGTPVLALAISCASRREALGELCDDEAAVTHAALPPGSTQFGFYAYGEVAPSARAACDLHNQAISLVTIRELLS